MAKRLISVFTDDMETCMFTGNTQIERHHIFGGSSRKASEKYGFVVPLWMEIHPNGANFNTAKFSKYREPFDTYLKRTAQKYFEEHYGSREEFRSIFGRSYL